MEPYVDFFGLMTYDLHGPWDAQVKQIGKVVLGQTNIPEIYNWTLPLWYDSVNPSKIVMGLAYYGRGYTLADPGCNSVGCAWSTVSRPGPCTNFGGVMSLQEIENLIPQLGVQPTLLANDMMKQLTWGDQWIGYDDLQTIAMKKQWASSHCFGGTMIWSIDLYSGAGSGNTPDGGGSSNQGDPGAGSGQGGASGGGSSGIVYIDPSIWSQANPVINCQPPCTFILPPLALPTPTTITFPPYVTSLDVAWSESTGWTSIVQTTTLTIPPVTTTTIEVWHYTVSNSNSASTVNSSFYVTSSIRLPPFTITNDLNPKSSPGVSHPPVTRTITPPPYPYTFTIPGNTQQPTPSATNTKNPAVFPIVTYKPGPPGPICRSGCGKPCLLFCVLPCLLDCVDRPFDFGNPKNPRPPARPTPVPSNAPLPTAQVVNFPTPPDPSGRDPQDPDQEEDDDKCAYEFNLPDPTYTGPIGKGTLVVSSAVAPSSSRPPRPSVSIAPPPPPPAPSPPPNPAPPSPNPNTEKLKCFDSGAWVDRGDLISALNDFCGYFAGTVLDASDPKKQRTLTGDYGAACAGPLGCFDRTSISVTVTNGCRFTMDGPSRSDQCGRILRQTIDKCDQSSTKFKQGGTVTSNFAIWSLDPNLNLVV